MNWYLEALKKYAVFAGRAHRKEYWMFCLFNIIIGFMFGVVGVLLDVLSRSNISADFLINIYILATLIPSIAVGVRRMHDTDHSGWWLLFPVVCFVLLVMKGTQGDNRFGPESNILKQEKEDDSGRYFRRAEQDEDAAIEKMLREADARAVEEAQRRTTHSIQGETQQNEEFISLLKSAINENGLNNIPDDDLIKIYKQAKSIEASSDIQDDELSKAINTVLEEIKKRGLSQDSTTPQEIYTYKNSFLKQRNAGGISKWIYAIAIPIIVIALVIIISNFSDKNETGTKAPKMHFDIQGYYEKYKDFYGDAPLDEVARDAFTVGGYDKEYPDYDTWKKSVGIEQSIQEDTKRRTPSFLDKAMGAIPFRYDEESIHGLLFRYDRFNKTVQLRQGSDENTFKWVPKPQFKNLQHVRDFIAQWERNRQNEELNRKQNIQNFRDMTDKWEADRLKRSVEDIRDTLEAEKRERQQMEMNRQFEEREREYKRQREELYR